MNDNFHLLPSLTLNLGIRFDGLPHTYERYNQFSNFVQANYNTSLGFPLNPDGTVMPGQLTTFGGSPFYLNGISLAGLTSLVEMSKIVTTRGNRGSVLPTISPEMERP